MYIVLELGGKTLMDYFHEKIEESGRPVRMLTTQENEVLLTKILLGAAQPVQQFHQRKKNNMGKDCHYLANFTGI